MKGDKKMCWEYISTRFRWEDLYHGSRYVSCLMLSDVSRAYAHRVIWDFSMLCTSL
jgi:hypothetical protein